MSIRPRSAKFTRCAVAPKPDSPPSTPNAHLSTGGDLAESGRSPNGGTRPPHHGQFQEVRQHVARIANRLFGLKLGEALKELPLRVFGRACIGGYQRDAEGK